MALDASRADGVVIKSFTVAPDLVRRGVTGEVVASELLDKLTGISDSAQSGAETGKFGAGWGQTISLQIPETGVSISEVDRWLREKLGHEQALGGEVVQNPDGTVTLAVRLDGHPLPPQTGAAADLPQLLQRTAETLYRRERPMAYVNYLAVTQRLDDWLAAGREMTDSHDPVVRAYGYGAMANVEQGFGKPDQAVWDFQLADAQNAGLSWPSADLGALALNYFGHPEAALHYVRRALSLAPHDPSEVPEAIHEMTLRDENAIAFMLGDHATALEKQIAFARGDNLGSFGSRRSTQLTVAGFRTWTHDGARADADAQAFAPLAPVDAMLKAQTLAYVAYGRHDWASLLPRIEAYRAIFPAAVQGPFFEAVQARAFTGLGRLTEAQARLASTPLDCVPCVTGRALLAEAQGRPAEADHWFSEASRIAPSIPEGPVEWGRVLLARGDAGRALAEFREALRRGPRAEEAMEGLGEALTLQGDKAAAVKQFAAANALTPRWGRLHLKWGEALANIGDHAGAKAQFELAATLDLTADEKADLARAGR
jgi:hypothetical protein